ncbi:MAG TPA: hypothetical protein VFU71_19550 [Burkholderiaceae bacterium]|nr:hypothetical protein [Burkholderiaceae bacterium]
MPSLAAALSRAGAAVALALATAPLLADDRPYVVVSSAAAEEDDDGVWSIESWATQLDRVRTFNVAPEYAFSPTTSLQLQLAGARDRDNRASASFAELEFKQLFNHIARDGYGWGMVAWLGAVKDGSTAVRRDEWGLKVPFTLSLWEGDGLLHVNAGFVREREQGRLWIAALALQREVWKRSVLFGELARVGDATFVHGGLRHWVKRERLALDLSLQRSRIDGAWHNGVTLGIGWYDL